MNIPNSEHAIVEHEKVSVERKGTGSLFHESICHRPNSL